MQATVETAIAVEAQARMRIAGWWERAGLEPTYPCGTETAISLLTAVEYRVDPETIARYIASGYIPGPGRAESGAMEWLAIDIAQLGFALEFRREWQAFSPLHDAKKSTYERGREQAERVGLADQACRDIDRYSVEDLLLLLRTADTQALRDALYVALRIKLERIDRLHE